MIVGELHGDVCKGAGDVHRQVDVPDVLFIFFGATGDLARRKLYPALYELWRSGELRGRMAVVGVSRRPFDDEAYREFVRKAVNEYRPFALYGEAASSFLERFFFLSADVGKPEETAKLAARIAEVEERFSLSGNRVFYLSIAPQHFAPIAQSLRTSGLLESRGFRRVVIEKPFGWDLRSARELNAALLGAFDERDIYRIDHYLGKAMVQNIAVLRFANLLFEPLWNRHYIAQVEITATETVGVGDRKGYYEAAGALRDMVQNHILQMVAMVAMEPPGRFEPEAIRDEKVKALRSLRIYRPEEVPLFVVRGQYRSGVTLGEAVPGYREEIGNPSSTTETYVAAVLFLENFRWWGVPFLVRTGKRLARKRTDIVIHFHTLPLTVKALSGIEGEELAPNRLILRVQPDEGIFLTFNVRASRSPFQLVPTAMELSRGEAIGFNTPEAYERLLYDVVVGDPTNFTRWDEVEAAWRWVDPIAEFFAAAGEEGLAFYPAGSEGPEEAQRIARRHGLPFTSLVDERAPVLP
ncbi:glucose-6-phosphate 1-dehydrogenase [Brockia lithotrophica]|uniref:Glucose-6-phosphate 1-dehydrogenase n=1 Tax=Brockia lithotrophica TaxID=933949 RepID=A0A660KYH6_9BACL|nr:glucose-6-phosphate 1-dehydrogenase [Brockia lithotrophica]